MKFSSHTAVLASAYLLLAAHSFGQSSSNNSSNALNFYVTTPQTGETRSVNASAQTTVVSNQPAATTTAASGENYYITQTAQQQTAATAQTSRQPSRGTASSKSRQTANSVQQVSNPAAQASIRQATAGNYYANTQTATQPSPAVTTQQANYYYQQQTTNPAYVSNASPSKDGFFKRMFHNHAGSNSGVAIDQASNAASRVKSAIMYPASKLNGSIQQGVASWYGNDFDGGPTASGETYDMDSMTAAHKSLPFGTMVKVKNERNGQECVVRINNRGPYSKGRIIDLSKAAARQLGMIGSGVAKVKMEVVGKKS